MKTLAVLVLLSTGCLGYVTGPAEPPATLVAPSTVFLGEKLSMRLDACLEPYRFSFLEAALYLSTYGIDLEIDPAATSAVTCAKNLADSDFIAETGPKRDGIKVRVDMFDPLDAPSRAHVVMHEVGHMLGADHVPSINSLMYPIVSEGTELTEDDLEALAQKDFPQREPSF